MQLVKILSCAIAVIIFTAGCKKASSISSGASIVGNWELRQIYANVGTINYPAGNNSIFKFSDSAYFTTDTSQSIIVRGNHQKTGTYKIIADNSAGVSTGMEILSGQFTSRLILDNDTSSDKIFIQIANNKLIFLSGSFPVDGGVKLTYQKN